MTVQLLFSLLSDRPLAIRLATSTALLRIVSKGLKEPNDKLQLIKVLSLTQVLDTLEARTREEQRSRKGDEADEGEESYREALGRLLNALGLELIKLIDVCFDLSGGSTVLTFNLMCRSVRTLLFARRPHESCKTHFSL